MREIGAKQTSGLEDMMLIGKSIPRLTATRK